MKCVLVTDTHLGIGNNDVFWTNVIENLFNEIIDLCESENIDTVIHLGDFFENRKSINVSTLYKGVEICEKFENRGINLYIIRGNHDTYYKNQSHPHSLKQLSLLNHVTVVDQYPVTVDQYTLVPWAYDITTLPEDSIVMGHFEVNGFIINASGSIHEGSTLNKSDFSKFKNVYSGHFHTPSQDGNITYIGSAFAQDFNDVDSTRGYYIIEDNKLTFIEYEDAPKFIRLTSNEEAKNVTGNVVSFTFLEDYGNVKNEQVVKSLQDMNPAKLYIDYAISTEEDIVMEEGEVLEVRNNSEVMREYIDTKTLPDHIKKPILKKMLSKIEGEMYG